MERTTRFRSEAFSFNKCTDSTVCVPLRSMLQHLTLLRIKETLRKQFADLANDFSQRLHGISLDLTSVEGPLEVYYPIFIGFFV